MSRSINGDNGNTGGVAITVMDQIESKQYVFDGELVLFQQTFVEPVTVKVDINLLYAWVGCTRASSLPTCRRCCFPVRCGRQCDMS